MRAQFERQPTLLAYCWYAWTNGMSAGVSTFVVCMRVNRVLHDVQMVLGLTATYAPQWPSSTTALHELGELILTFKRAAELGGRALPALVRLNQRYPPVVELIRLITR